MATRLRVFEKSDGTRFVKQLTNEDCAAYVAANPDFKLIR